MLVVVSLLATACPREQRAPSDRSCASACTGLVEVECPLAAHQSCLRACDAERASAAQARCGVEYEAFLSCLSRAKAACPDSPAESVRLGAGLSSCQRQYTSYSRCARACREHGVVRTGARLLEVDERQVSVQAELVTSGCGRALPLEPRGAPPGSRCEYQSVCAPVTCSCPSATEGYRARVCVDGACAGAESACRLAPRAVGHQVCRP